MNTDDQIHEMLRDIRELGYSIDSVYDLMYINNKHRELIPVILHYLRVIDDEELKDLFVRSLTVKGFREASLPLIEAFRRSKNMSTKWSIGNALYTRPYRK